MYHGRHFRAVVSLRMSQRPEHRAHRAASRPEHARRRAFLTAGAAILASPLLVGSQRALASASATRTLSFLHTHTGETLSVAYAQGSTYVAAALAQVNWLLRDFRNDEVLPIDPQLLDQLHAVTALTGSKAPFEVISGYRSPATNESLRKRGGGGVATRSLHLEGRAIDVRLADVPLGDLCDAALSMKAGGVGFYAESRFVHLDTGRVRRW
jgi:uncharacterized protein YcbK (DUF882 family)